jgi:4'-phosphopantetheinyl transferase EntD
VYKTSVSGDILAQSMYCAPVSVAIATREMYSQKLFDAEEETISKSALSRRMQFTAGRSCARAALSQLGVQAGPLLADRDGVPVWPAGFLGSITHCADFCCAVIGRRFHFQGLGIDAEPLQPISDELASWIASPNELAGLGLPPTNTSWLNVIFSAKEAFYKAYFPNARVFLEFRDVEVELEGSSATDVSRFFVHITNDKKAPLRANCIFDGRWMLTDHHLICTASLRDDES